MTPRSPSTDQATVWQADPGDPVGHACEPRVTRLASGSIVLSHRVGTTRERRRRAAAPRPERRRRRDRGGCSASPFEGALPVGWDLRGARSRRSRTAVSSRSSSRSTRRLDGPRTTRTPKGSCRSANLVARSDDGGATWSEPWELADGRYLQHAQPGPARRCPTAASCARSRRSRRTTTPASGATPAGLSAPTTAAGPGASRSSRPRPIPTATRTTRCGGTRASPGWRPATSSSATTPSATRPGRRARSTSPGAPTMARPGRRRPRPACPGRRPIPVPLPDGRLVVFQQRRGESRRWSRSASDDGGRTFDRGPRRVVYAPRRRVGAGCRRLAQCLRLPDVMDRFTFGHPCGVVTGPDEVLVVLVRRRRRRGPRIRSARLRID